MRRCVLFFLVFTLLFSSSALANDVTLDSEPIDSIEFNLEGSPRYSYLTYMTIGLDIDENGYLSYGGSARTIGYDLRITVTLQRSNNGVFWDDLESYVKTGRDYVSVSGSRTVEEGDYFYRAKIITDVFDSNRNILETATGYSSEERY